MKKRCIICPMGWGNGAYVAHRYLEQHIPEYNIKSYHPYWTLIPFALPAVAGRRAGDPSMLIASNKKAILGCLAFLFKQGQYFTCQLLRSFGHYSLLTRMLAVTNIAQYIYSLIIYHRWAEEKAKELYSAYPDALFVFDLDEASKELMISDSLNQNEKKRCSFSTVV